MILKKISPVWCLIGLIAFADAAGLPLSGMKLAVASLLFPVLGLAAAIALAAIYTGLRPDARIASLARMTAELLAYTGAAAILSYLMATLRQPLLDQHLVAVDRALGFDWPAMYAWVVAHPWVRLLLWAGYMSLIPQLILLLVILNFRGQINRSRELLWLYIVSSLGCVLFSGPWPTAGAFATFHVQLDEPYVAQFLALRDGTLKMLDLRKMQGVVQFPSLHLALALLFVYAARGIPILFPAIVLLNLLLAMATPAIGGHHLADLFGGVALAALALFLVRTGFALTAAPGTKIGRKSS